MTTDINYTSTKRPIFLKVLLILSFIMCGLTILMQVFFVVYSLIAYNKNYDQIDKHSVMDQAMFFAASTGGESLKELIIGLVSLVGVFLMWKLKKLGFYIYLIAETFLYFEFAFLMLSWHADTKTAIGVGVEMIWPLPFDLAFIIMYATQLKHMTWKLKPITADIQA